MQVAIGDVKCRGNTTFIGSLVLPVWAVGACSGCSGLVHMRFRPGTRDVHCGRLPSCTFSCYQFGGTDVVGLPDIPLPEGQCSGICLKLSQIILVTCLTEILLRFHREKDDVCDGDSVSFVTFDSWVQVWVPSFLVSSGLGGGGAVSLPHKKK